MLGGALLGQKKYAEAEPLLIAGYEGMKQREATIPPQGKDRLTEALERLVQLYEATDKPDEAAEWRKELEANKSAEKPPEKKLSPARAGRPLSVVSCQLQGTGRRHCRTNWSPSFVEELAKKSPAKPEQKP